MLPNDAGQLNQRLPKTPSPPNSSAHQLMAAIGELRRRGSHKAHKARKTRLRAPLAALAAIAAIVYVAKRLATDDRPHTREAKAQERKKLARHPLFAFEKRRELYKRWPDGTLGMVVSAYRDDLNWLRNVEAIGIRTHVLSLIHI